LTNKINSITVKERDFKGIVVDESP
jgi:hypothetical protein